MFVSVVDDRTLTVGEHDILVTNRLWQFHQIFTKVSSSSHKTGWGQFSISSVECL